MTSKFWLRNDQSELSKWQKNISELATDSFCILPWIHVSTRANGDMRVCCVANSGGAGTNNSTRGVIKNKDGLPTNLSTVPIDTAWNESYLKNIRQSMLEGRAPESCERCYREESQGMSSKRIWETLTWHKKGTDINQLINNTSSTGEVKFNAKYLDLRLGNTCNLACIMCSSHDSSYWLRDHNQTYDKFTHPDIIDQRRFDPNKYKNLWWEDSDFWHKIEEQIPNIEHIAFAGGEPLLIKQHRDLLKTIIKQNRHNDIELRYTTNGTVLDDELLELWSNFKNVHLTVSMDGIDQRLEYIRWPIDAGVLYKNLDILDNTDSNIKVNLAVAVQLLNIHHIPDFIKWKVQKQFKKINLGVNASGYKDGGGLLVPNLVWTPTWLSIQSLPQEHKQQILEKFNDLKIWLLNNYTDSNEFWQQNPYGWSRWEGILNWMMSKDCSNNLQAFKEYITIMDTQRNTNFTTVFPELTTVFIQKD